MADTDSAWHGELEQRLEAYRVRRQHISPDAVQSRLPFDEEPERARAKSQHTIALEEPLRTAEDDFSFTIAIGRYAPPSEKRDARMLIDVSIPPASERATGEESAEEES